MRTQGLQAAGQLSLAALAAGVEHPSLLNLAASVRHREGRFEEAAQLLKRARALAPNDPHLLNSLGICLKALGRTEEALQAYSAALRIDRDMAPAHFNRGALLEELNDVKGARSAYERAAALDPNYVDAVARLAWLDAQAGDAASARTHGERALARSPANLLARIALASADLQRGDLPGASGRLFDLSGRGDLGPVNSSIVLGLIGDLKDAEGETAEAFAAYAASNAELKALHAPRFEAAGSESALDHARRLTTWFEAAEPEPWREAPPQRPRAADPKAHIFLVGFPRSGTTPRLSASKRRTASGPLLKHTFHPTMVSSASRGSVPARRCANVRPTGRWPAGSESSRAAGCSSTRCRSPASRSR